MEDDDDDISSNDDESSSGVLTPPAAEAAVAIHSSTGATTVDDSSTSKFPHLSRALGDGDGYFDPADPGIEASLRGLLQEINHLLSTYYELNVKALSSNKPISYVRVPRTKSDNSFTNSKEWLDTAIKISGSSHGGTYESAYRISKHLITFYKDSFLAACNTRGVPVIKPMTATEFQSMLHAGKVSRTGERELKKHLSTHLGQGFCPT